MTPEQVSALSDAELERAMIWLYPPEGKHWMDPDTGTHYMFDEYDLYQIHMLDDYNLTMPLVIEEKIQINPKPYTKDTWKAYRSIGSRSFSASNKRYLRAACECLVLIALADK
jgi:hypothetical protein